MTDKIVNYEILDDSIKKIKFKEHKGNYKIKLKNKTLFITGKISLVKIDYNEEKKINNLKFKLENKFAEFINNMKNIILKKFEKHVIEKGYDIKNILDDEKEGIYSCKFKDMKNGDTSVYCFYKDEKDAIEDLNAQTFGDFFKQGDEFTAAFKLSHLKEKNKKIKVFFKLYNLEFVKPVVKQYSDEESFPSSDSEESESDSDSDYDY